LVAIFLQSLAIAFAGFLAGVYLVFSLLNAFGQNIGIGQWVFIIIGGLVGCVLAVVFFDATLIVASSLIGATFIVQNINFNPFIKTGIFMVLLVMGMVIQFGQNHNSPANAAAKKAGRATTNRLK
jgi:arginine exporter protein ArgO